MHVILFAAVDFPETDAPGERASLIVKGLRAVEVRAVLAIPHASRTGNVANNKRTVGKGRDVPFAYLSGHTLRPKNPFLAVLDSLRGMLAGCALLLRRKLKGKVDAVILYSPDTIEYLPIILFSLLLRIPLFIEICEMMTASTDSNWKVSFRKIGYYLTERLLPRLAHGYVVISTKLQEHYWKMMSGECIHLMPILVDQGRNFASAESAKSLGKLILYSGSFGEKDGVIYLLRAFALVVRERPDAEFVLTGNATKLVRSALESMARDLKIDKSIKFTGFVTRKELGTLQHQATVLLVCRTRSAYASHGFPWKVGEYCMSSTPMVATRVGDLEKYFEDNVSIYFADPEDPPSIAAGILKALKDPQKAWAVAAKAKEVAANHFDHEIQGQKLFDFLSGRIAGRKR